ncbi:putative DD41D transposase [Trichonephila clavipes]|nr:putative DD41D transposase [Trichonephila clavipes]
MQKDSDLAVILPKIYQSQSPYCNQNGKGKRLRVWQAVLFQNVLLTFEHFRTEGETRSDNYAGPCDGMEGPMSNTINNHSTPLVAAIGGASLCLGFEIVNFVCTVIFFKLPFERVFDNGTFVTAVTLPLTKLFFAVVKIIHKKAYLSPLERDLPGKVSLNDSCLMLSSDLFSVFGLAIHQNDHQARRRFVEWAQNEIAVNPDFHKRILFSDEAHFWLNGYVNKQNCRIWSEANPQVYVETPLHPEKLTVWCALWAGGILLQKR